jgi:hypothetical protein
MKRICTAFAVIAILGVAAPSFAQDRVIQQEDKTVYKKKTVIDFSDVSIQGELTKPQGSYLLNRRRTRFTSLLKTRQDFLPELVNSTDNL